jgi:dTMP kinase
LQGVLVVIEGIEGAGKSTVAQAIAEFAKGRGYDALITRDPGGTELGERVREILLRGEESRSPITETFLFMAARRQLVDERIIPALEAGKCVVLDRFLLSTMAYQGVAGGVGIETVLTLGQIAVGSVIPAMTLLLDLPVEEGFRRIEKSRSYVDKIEGRGLDYHRAVRDGFLLARRHYPWPLTTIDASRPLDEVHKAAIEAVADVL